jgi:hypothetical protein
MGISGGSVLDKSSLSRYKIDSVHDMCVQKAENISEFKFFKCCSASLKRFSVLMFVINIFLSITVTGIGAVLCAVYVGVEMLVLLALRIATVFVIFIVIARFISALIYGYAEIVEKIEKQ